MKKSAEAIVETYLIQEILNRRFLPGVYLPPERELSERLGFSRPVIHKAIIRLEGKGLVTIKARQGVIVNDYRVSGKLDLLDALYDLYRTGIDLRINQSMLAFVQSNFETLLVSLCLKGSCTSTDVSFACGEDVFYWIQHYAMQSENVVYAMLFNEFKTGIINVGNVMMHSAPLAFQNGRAAIDAAVTVKNTKLILKKSGQWFAMIEKEWIGGDSY